MLKRTYGLLLLGLLVITGLAGTINNTSLSLRERKSAINLMKDTKAEILNSVQGLSNSQLNFKTTPENLSVKESVYSVVTTEKNLWDLLEATMKAPANPEKRSAIKITDKQLIKMMDGCNSLYKATKEPETKKIKYKTLNEALESFKTRRAEQIKYIKLTTEDLRDHVVQMPFGWLDCYQLCLIIAAQSKQYEQQIDVVKTDPNFPKS